MFKNIYINQKKARGLKVVNLVVSMLTINIILLLATFVYCIGYISFQDVDDMTFYEYNTFGSPFGEKSAIKELEEDVYIAKNKNEDSIYIYSLNQFTIYCNISVSEKDYTYKSEKYNFFLRSTDVYVVENMYVDSCSNTTINVEDKTIVLDIEKLDLDYKVHDTFEVDPFLITVIIAGVTVNIPFLVVYFYVLIKKDYTLRELLD